MNLSTSSSPSSSRERKSGEENLACDNNAFSSSAPELDNVVTDSSVNSNQSNHQTYKPDEMIHVPNLGKV